VKGVDGPLPGTDSIGPDDPGSIDPAGTNAAGTHSDARGTDVRAAVGAPAVGVHPALRDLLGHWRGSTRLAAGPWGPERTVEADVTYLRVASGFGVVQTYSHREPDGTHFEGHGMFTVDPDHPDVLWYHADTTDPVPAVPDRCTWRGGVLRVERHGSAGWTRHSVRLDGDVLIHVTELRSREPSSTQPGGGSAENAGADGTGSAYTLFMTSTFTRA
jgi:hypothetical protein